MLGTSCSTLPRPTEGRIVGGRYTAFPHGSRVRVHEAARPRLGREPDLLPDPRHARPGDRILVSDAVGHSAWVDPRHLTIE